MDDKTADPRTMLRRALQAQVDLGLGEVILGKSSSKRDDTLIDEPPDSSEAVETDVFGETGSGLPSAEFDSIESHVAAICECQACPLGATRNKFVYGVGNPEADLMFIGEAPGADEDRLGEPFVGRAGQLLDKILTAINFSRENIYIANILKCRPPGNRDPQPDEMAQCFPYLKEQIALIRPKLLCALGRIAAQALLEVKTPLGKLRGQWHEYQGVPLLVTYHPAALLRFPGYKRDTWEDVQLLRTRYDELRGR